MSFFIENWSILVAFVCGVVVCLAFCVKFAKEPTERKIAMVKEWLLYAVIQAEREIGGEGVGQIKLRYVWDLFIKTFPSLAPLVSFEMFSKLVDEALEQMKHLLQTNSDMLFYIKNV